MTTEAVLAVAHELGLENLSVAAVADRLRVARVSVHRFVGSREDLETLLGEDIIDSSPQVVDEGESVEEYLLKVARALQQLIRDHPGLATYYARGFPRSERSARRMEASVQALMRRGLPAGPAARLVSSVATIAISSTQYHVARDAYWNGERPGVALDPGEFPAITASHQADAWEDWQEWTLRSAVRGMIRETYAAL